VNAVNALCYKTAMLLAANDTGFMPHASIQYFMIPPKLSPTHYASSISELSLDLSIFYEINDRLVGLKTWTAMQ
jgi:hypothetical protein